MNYDELFNLRKKITFPEEEVRDVGGVRKMGLTGHIGLIGRMKGFKKPLREVL